MRRGRLKSKASRASSKFVLLRSRASAQSSMCALLRVLGRVGQGPPGSWAVPISNRSGARTWLRALPLALPRPRASRAWLLMLIRAR